MKRTPSILIPALSLLAALSGPSRLDAQAAPANPPHTPAPRYIVRDLGTLGGTYSSPGGMNSQGWVNGTSTLPGDTDQHAFLWRGGQMIDLGTLGGPNSGSLFRLDDAGDVAGAAETAALNPYGYQFCNYMGFSDDPDLGSTVAPHSCLPFLWQRGRMTRLPILGGYNGGASQINNRGQIAGGSEIGAFDRTCLPTLLLEQKPVIWDNGQVRELPLFHNDVEGFAFSINDLGQATGYSGNGLCANVLAHNVVWQNGTVVEIDLSQLPGGASGLPSIINNRGHVVGFSGVPPGIGGRAYLWENGHTTNLGLVYGSSSAATGINNQDQIVGQSCADFPDCHAFVWQNGVMTDLNKLVPAGTPTLIVAIDINDQGQITGALVTSKGEVHTFVATPSNNFGEGDSLLPASQDGASPVVLSEDVRTRLQQSLRFGGLGSRQPEPR